MTNLQEIFVTPRQLTFQRQAEHIITNLNKRNINGTYFGTKEDAVNYIASLVPERSIVALGGSVTVIQSGLLDRLRTMNINLIDRYRDGLTKEEIDEQRKRSRLSDVLIASSNAITIDGKIVNEDGFGNRVAAMIAGPSKVILMIGMNKIVPTVEAAIARIKNVAAPLNCVRLGKDTPCARTGFCDDEQCVQPERICSFIVTIESCAYTNRMNVVLVGEELGY